MLDKNELQPINEALDQMINDPKVSIFKKLWIAFIVDILNWIYETDERRMLKISQKFRNK